MATLAERDAIDVMQEGVLFGLPMPLTFRPPFAMSDEELIAFSLRNRPYQVERNARGELEIMSPTGWDGMRREQYVSRMLGNWAEENGGESAGPTAGFKLKDSSVRGPDAAWIASGTVSRLTREERRKFPPLCPEFLIEVLSESDSRSTLENKMQMWIDAGAQLAWMIDPYAATVSIYRPGVEVEVLERPDSVEAGEPIAGFRLSTRLLWDE